MFCPTECDYHLHQHNKNIIDFLLKKNAGMEFVKVKRFFF